MKLKGTLFTAGVAMLLWAVPSGPAGAAAAGPSLTSSAMLGVDCWPGLYFTQTGGAFVTAEGSIYCSGSIDYIQVDVQLRRYGGVVAGNTCGSTSGSLACPASVPCQPGTYQATAQYQMYSTSGNGDYASYSTPSYNITC